jgi:hypothetical protein
MRGLAIVLIGFGIAGPSAQAVAAGSMPPLVSARMDEDAKTCDTHDVKFEPGFVTRKDVNADGKPDFILDYAHFSCGGSHTFCGSGGCSIVVFASSTGGYVKAVDDLVRQFRFDTIKGRPAMLVGLHGSACGKAGSVPCGETLFWNGQTFGPAH